MEKNHKIREPKIHLARKRFIESKIQRIIWLQKRNQIIIKESYHYRKESNNNVVIEQNHGIKESCGKKKDL